MHRGSIEVESKKEEGTLFRVKLPLFQVTRVETELMI